LGTIIFIYDIIIIMETQTEQKVVSSLNILSTVDSFNSKKKLKKIIKIIILIIIFTFIFRPVLVLNSKTFLPISGASVVYNTYDGWNGYCRSNSSPFNTILGLSFHIIIPACEILVSKDGYHQNGSDEVKKIDGLFGLKIILLNKIEDPQENFVYFNLPIEYINKINLSSNFNKFQNFFNESKRMKENMPYYVYDPFPVGVKPTGKNEDFNLKLIKVEGEGKNHNYSLYEIEFFGKGGIRSTDNDNFNYGVENVFEAPIGGYKQKMQIEAGRTYVAKLSDGVHYMKFYIDSHYYGSEMIGFVQLLESRNLEFVDIFKFSYPDDQSDVDSINYLNKQEYIESNYKINNKHTIKRVDIFGGNMYMVQFEDMLDEPLYLAKNNNRFTETYGPISTKSLQGVSIDVELAPYDASYGSFSPVDLFLNGKYIDPLDFTENSMWTPAN